MRSLMVLAMFAGAATACGSAGEPIEPGRTYQVQAGDTVELHVGESALLGSEGASVTFTRVVADSRCPVDVTCVWAGDAHIQLEATGPSPDAMTIDLHTGVQPVDATFAGFRIRLVDVGPARRQADEIGPRDYSVRLAISRG